jgi:hypothetical protein
VRRCINGARRFFADVWLRLTLLQGQAHILHDITFRDCTRAATGVRINAFLMLTHSDEFVPEVRVCGAAAPSAPLSGGLPRLS